MQVHLLLLNALTQDLHWLIPTLADFHDIFLKFPSVLEKMVRPVIIYCFLVVGLRLAGKRELAQLNPFDLVVLLTLSNAVQNAIIGDDNSITGGIIGATTLLAVNYLVVRFLFRHRRLDEVIEGKSTTLIENGHIRPKALAKELITRSELLTVAHRQGFASLDEIEACILESGGTFFMKGKTPLPDETRHSELLERLNQISKQLAALQARS
jgi:uncharacterized membrane protein YcaP (DUF421 family)